MKRLVLAAMMLMTVASCGLDFDGVRAGPTPTCDTTSRGTLILMAQAMPEASYVPCFILMPPEWALATAEIETGDVELSVDRAGVGDVEVQLTSSCEPEGNPISLELPADVDVFDSGETEQRRWLVFDGGCVVIETVGNIDLSSMVDLVSLISRDELRRLSGLDL